MNQNPSYMDSKLSPMPEKGFLDNLFKKVDRNNDGSITAMELHMALSNGPWMPFCLHTVKLMIAMFDESNTGLLKLESFALLWKYLQDWEVCFHHFDQDDDGFIDVTELTGALSMFGYKLSMKPILSMIKKFDRLDEHEILFDDFIQLCIKLNLLTTQFHKLDTEKVGKITVEYEQFLEMVFGTTI